MAKIPEISADFFKTASFEDGLAMVDRAYELQRANLQERHTKMADGTWWDAIKGGLSNPEVQRALKHVGVGTAVGGGIGYLSALRQPKERRNYLSRMLGGAMLGGLGGAGTWAATTPAMPSALGGSRDGVSAETTQTAVLRKRMEFSGVLAADRRPIARRVLARAMGIPGEFPRTPAGDSALIRAVILENNWGNLPLDAIKKNLAELEISIDVLNEEVPDKSWDADIRDPDGWHTHALMSVTPFAGGEGGMVGTHRKLSKKEVIAHTLVSELTDPGFLQSLVENRLPKDREDVIRGASAAVGVLTTEAFLKSKIGQELMQHRWVQNRLVRGIANYGTGGKTEAAKGAIPKILAGLERLVGVPIRAITELTRGLTGARGLGNPPPNMVVNPPADIIPAAGGGNAIRMIGTQLVAAGYNAANPQHVRILSDILQSRRGTQNIAEIFSQFSRERKRLELEETVSGRNIPREVHDKNLAEYLELRKRTAVAAKLKTLQKSLITTETQLAAGVPTRDSAGRSKSKAQIARETAALRAQRATIAAEVQIAERAAAGQKADGRRMTKLERGGYSQPYDVPNTPKAQKAIDAAIAALETRIPLEERLSGAAIKSQLRGRHRRKGWGHSIARGGRRAAAFFIFDEGLRRLTGQRGFHPDYESAIKAQKELTDFMDHVPTPEGWAAGLAEDQKAYNAQRDAMRKKLQTPIKPPLPPQDQPSPTRPGDFRVPLRPPKDEAPFPLPPLRPMQ